MTKPQVTILIIGALIVVVGAAVLFSAEPPAQTDAENTENQVQDTEDSSDATDQESQSQTDEDNGAETSEDEADSADQVITRTADGYEPRNVTIEKGGTVLWENESGNQHWPASDVHPTHRIYPAFDADRPIPPGESWSFTFEQAGEWKFHDHLRANLTGTVTVTE